MYVGCCGKNVRKIHKKDIQKRVTDGKWQATLVVLCYVISCSGRIFPKKEKEPNAE